MSRGEQFQGRKITKISSPPQILIVPFFTYHKKRKNNSIIAQNHAISPSLIYNPSFSESAFLFFPSSIQFHFLFFTYKIEFSLDRLFHHSINLFLKRSPLRSIQKYPSPRQTERNTSENGSRRGEQLCFKFKWSKPASKNAIKKIIKTRFFLSFFLFYSPVFPRLSIQKGTTIDFFESPSTKFSALSFSTSSSSNRFRATKAV